MSAAKPSLPPKKEPLLLLKTEFAAAKLSEIVIPDSDNSIYPAIGKMTKVPIMRIPWRRSVHATA